MVDRLKARVKEKDQELEKLHKAHDMTKNVLERYLLFYAKNVQIFHCYLKLRSIVSLSH